MGIKSPVFKQSRHELFNKIMKASQIGLWSIWVSGILLIALSIYATNKLSLSKNPNFSHGRFSGIDAPRITLFTAPAPFTGSLGTKQSLAIRSWLALSPQITVILFSQHPSVASFASSFGSRVLVEPNIDFSFLGVPFFHSMVARSQAFRSDIYAFIHSETILLPDFVLALNYAHELDRDWLLFASSRNVSTFPFYLDEDGKYWLRKDGKRVRMKELQEKLGSSSQWNCCDGRMMIAWNNVEVPLHHGVLPPFLYGRGAHNHWLINEALSSGLRLVFDASRAISSFVLHDSMNGSNCLVKSSRVSDIENESWEYDGNSHLASLYGSSSLHKIDYSEVVKLLKCDGQYLLITTTEDIIHPHAYKRMGLWTGSITKRWRSKKTLACLARIKKSQNRMLGCSMKDQSVPSKALKFPFSLESLLEITADKNRTVVLTVAGYSYKDMLMSWVCRLRHLRITNFLVCALDDETYQFSVMQGLPVFNDPSAPSNISFNDCHFGTKCFQRVTKVKSRMVLKILKLGYNVLLSDVDVYWFGNPLPLLSSFGPAILAAQSDEYNQTGPINLPRRLNSGFYFARADIPTIAAMEKVVRHAATSGLSEQPSFYDTLCGERGATRKGDNRCVEPETNLTTHFLDRNLFPNGAYLGLWESENVKLACKKQGCLVLHNNWISGRLKKLERQCADIFGFVRHANHDSRSTKDLKEAPFSVDLSLQSRSRNISVRIVHAGGREELYQNTIPVSHLLEKYPGMCIARPDVFKNPDESLLRPEDILLPGQKYLVIPFTTVQKLKRRHQKKVKHKEGAESREDSSDAKITWDISEENSEDSVYSAKEFYETKPSKVSKVPNERHSRHPVRKGRRVKKPFVPPLPRTRPLWESGWEPSLTSVQELSP
ncbi:Reticulon [Corchorus capsularis]|uniref:Reticulon n=1 Tax=Corchorus capsularis TaxID=210143 RepID=A0A1R3I700_COCAP|nr:Reticulon [Corchorus capsularis]